MIRIGTEVLYKDDGLLMRGPVERNSLRTGRHMVRVTDMWFDRESVWTPDEYDAMLLEALEGLPDETP